MQVLLNIIPGLPAIHSITKAHSTSQSSEVQLSELPNGMILMSHDGGLEMYDGWQWETILERQFGVESHLLNQNHIYLVGRNLFGRISLQDIGGDDIFEDLSDFFKEFGEDIRIKKMLLFESHTLFYSDDFLFALSEDDELVEILNYCPEPQLNALFIYDNEAYIHCDNNQIRRLRLIDGDFSTSTYGFFPSEISGITAIHPLAENVLLVVTETTYSIYEDGLITHHLPLPKGVQVTASTKTKNHIIVGTLGDGIFVFSNDGEKLWHLTESEVKPNRVVYTIKKDQSNSVWIACNQGINVITLENGHTYFDRRNGLPGIPSLMSESDDYYLLAIGTELWQIEKASGDLGLIQDVTHPILSMDSNGLNSIISSEKGLHLFEGGNLKVLSESHFEHIIPLGESYLGVNKNSWVEFEIRSGNFHVRHAGNLPGNKVTNLFLVENHIYGYLDDEFILIMQYHPENGPEVLSVISETLHPDEKIHGVFFDKGSVFVAGETTIYELKNSALTRDDFLTDELNASEISHASGSGFLIQDKVVRDKFRPVLIRDSLFLQIPHLVTSSDKSAFVLEANDGAVWFNQNNRLVRFDPTAQFIEDYPKPVLRNLLAYKENQRLIGPFDEINNISLPHNMNTVFKRFFTPGRGLYESVTYQTRLFGFNDEWSDWFDFPIRLYSNLPYGDYNLEIRASFGGFVSSEITTLAFSIQKPWYLKEIALAAYLIFIVILIFGTIRYRRYQQDAYLHKLEIEVNDRTKKLQDEKQRLSKQAEELNFINNQRTQFFNNISHEFRTPLTLIMAPLQRILDEGNLSTDDQNAMEVAFRNAQRLRSLTNQMLDITRVKKGISNFSPSRGDIKVDILMIARRFVFRAHQEGKEFGYRLPENDVIGNFESEKIDVILTNLISNAFKYTKTGDKVILTAGYTKNEQNENFLKIRVEDTGIGVPADQLEFIFDYYYQVEMNEMSYSEGTGVGLAYVKDLVEMHGGEVKVESRIGVFTGFEVTIPAFEYHADADFDKMLKKKIILFEEEVTSKTSDNIIPPKVDAAGTLLIVEDNADLQRYLTILFSDKYHVNVAGNGKQALKELEKYRPSLIISDVMMPEMDGWTFLNILKGNEDLKTIPVIMLTALTEIEDRLKALQTGVDDYISKPFDKNELLVRVENLIKNMEERSKYLKRAESEESSESTSTSELFNRIISIIEENMANHDFSSNDLAQALAMSERSMYQKVKAETGLTPVQLINQKRIEKSRQMLLKDRDKTVGEISFDCGLSSSNYFSRVFRKVTGTTPLEYRKSRI